MTEATEPERNLCRHCGRLKVLNKYRRCKDGCKPDVTPAPLSFECVLRAHPPRS